MPRRLKPNYDFDIHADPSRLSEPMDAEPLSQSGDVEKKKETLEAKDDIQQPDSVQSEPKEEQPSAPKDTDEKQQPDEVLPSIETEQAGAIPDLHEPRPGSSASRRSSTRTEEIIQAAARDIIAHIEQHNKAKQEGGGGSEEEEDVFSDKSPRSSLGSYDLGSTLGSESGKSSHHEQLFPDNLTTITTRSPRISDISQYDDGHADEEEEEETFVPTIRGTPRPVFRTPSDVRAIQMSSPTQSVVNGPTGSPRSSRRYMPTVSRLGTPTTSAQYSPKKTPDRLKPRKEAPLVLLHVTLLPLRWAWGDLVGGLESASDLSADVKALRDAWRLLQDRLGDTTCERGILLGHPQNDYEVLEERLLDALELPVRRRARILECGHYLGPANEMADDVDAGSEYNDDDIYGSTYGGGDDDADARSHRSGRRADKRHWCTTCRGDIRYETLGAPGRVFRVKVYASNGLMKAGAWAACWKEMERVDVEIEPVVSPALQDELVRLAAAQQEAQREEDEIAHEVDRQFAEEKKKEEQREESRRSRGRSSRRRSGMRARVDDAEEDEDIPPAETAPAPTRQESVSSERRRRLEEERLREIYGESSSADEKHEEHAPATTSEPSHHRDASAHHQPHADPYARPDSPHSHSQGGYGSSDSSRQKLDNASFPELLFESVRVLLQDKKNVAIIALSIFVLLLAVRTARHDPLYESSLHSIMANVPEMRYVPVVEAPDASEHSSSFEDDAPVVKVPRADVHEAETEASEFEHAPEIQEALVVEATEETNAEEQAPATKSEACIKRPHAEQPSVGVVEEPAVDTDETAAAETSIGGKSEQIPGEAAAEIEDASNDYDACVALRSAQRDASFTMSETAASADAEADNELFVTQKRTVKVVQTVTETETQVEYIKVTATSVFQQPEPTSPAVEGSDDVICDTINWGPPVEDVEDVEGVEGKGGPMIEAAAEVEVDGNSEVDEMRDCPPEVEEAA